mmetsp:Transcript_30060/g.86521  ORF Transcript_30060/g.86521 Transcript_30060/m.86521 type:complete len:409 (-) Transcript_30060:488-1714(-)
MLHQDVANVAHQQELLLFAPADLHHRRDLCQHLLARALEFRLGGCSRSGVSADAVQVGGRSAEVVECEAHCGLQDECNHQAVPWRWRPHRVRDGALAEQKVLDHERPIRQHRSPTPEGAHDAVGDAQAVAEIVEQVLGQHEDARLRIQHLGDALLPIRSKGLRRAGPGILVFGLSRTSPPARNGHSDANTWVLENVGVGEAAGLLANGRVVATDAEVGDVADLLLLEAVGERREGEASDRCGGDAGVHIADALHKVRQAPLREIAQVLLDLLASLREPSVPLMDNGDRLQPNLHGGVVDHQEDTDRPLVLQMQLNIGPNDPVEKAESVHPYDLADIAASWRYDRIEHLRSQSHDAVSVAGDELQLLLQLDLLLVAAALREFGLALEGLPDFAQLLQVNPHRLDHRQRP